MKANNVLCISLVISLLVTITSVDLVYAELTMIYVHPSSVTVDVYDTFTINISVADVTELYSFDFKLRYNTTLLDYVEINPGEFFFNASCFFFEPEVNDTTGTIWVVGSKLSYAPPASGAGTLAAITFNCSGLGECILDLNDTILLDPSAELVSTPPYLGDVNEDFYVDARDVIYVAIAYGSRVGEPEYNPKADFNNDTFIDLMDLQFATLNLGRDYNQTSLALMPTDNIIVHGVVDGYVIQEENPPHGPSAAFAYTPNTTYTCETVIFDASESLPGWTGHENATITKYAWDFETDGNVDRYGMFTSYECMSSGNFTVTLNVTDSQGLWDTESHIVSVLERPPPPTLEEAITAGVAYLAASQNSTDGSWGIHNDVKPAYTGLVLTKLQMHAYELGFESPFDPDYLYSGNVTAGWEFIFSHDGQGTPIYAVKQDLSLQNHTGGASGTIDDPDVNENGYGIYFTGYWDNFSAYSVYTTGIALMALQASGTPDRVNDGGIDYDDDGFPDTLIQIAQDAADWLAWAQGDSDLNEGGYGYEPLDNADASWFADNSNSGYAVLGLAAAEGFGCTVPGWVRTELNVWITNIQNPVDGDPEDGGSQYTPDYQEYVNELETGNLIFQMTFCGDTPDVQRFKDAIAYVERHWHDLTINPGWGFGMCHSDYQAMFCLMKGFEYSGINLIDLDGNGTAEHDWYEEFTTVLRTQQHPTDGYWYLGYYGGAVIDTAWALLTLEKISPIHLIHDMAVVNVTTSKAGCLPAPTVGQGFTVTINVTVENQGNFTESFNITAYANTSVIGIQDATNLLPGEQTTLTFTWNTTGFDEGNYTISAYAWPVPGETDTVDNTFLDGTVYVGIVGDVNGDDKVDMIDIGICCLAYGSYPGHSKWNPNADINDDGKVDMIDIGLACLHYGETNP